MISVLLPFERTKEQMYTYVRTHINLFTVSVTYYGIEAILPPNGSDALYHMLKGDIYSMCTLRRDIQRETNVYCINARFFYFSELPIKIT